MFIWLVAKDGAERQQAMKRHRSVPAILDCASPLALSNRRANFDFQTRASAVISLDRLFARRTESPSTHVHPY
jgi:hypothetical protein